MTFPRHWLRSLSGWFAETVLRRPPVYRAQSVGELPEPLDPRTLYLAGEGGHLWYAAMSCPCGCGKLLQMNLIPTTRPCWTATVHDDKSVTLHPSVWRQTDCRAHFWLRRGRVTWCTPTPRGDSSRP